MSVRRAALLYLNLLVMIITGCGEPVKARRLDQNDAAALDSLLQESWQVKVDLTESGIHKGMVQAAHQTEYKTRQGSQHHLDGGIIVTLFDQHGHATTTITAEKAVIHDNQDIEAIGNVVMRSSTDGTVITSEYAKRSARDKMIRSNRLVTITRNNETIRGEGFESDQSLKKYRIFRGSGEAFIH